MTTNKINYNSNGNEYSIEILNESNTIIIKLSKIENLNTIPIVFIGKYNFNELKEKNNF